MIVEDTAPLAMLTKLQVEELGSEVIGPFATIAEARQAIADNRPHLALLDMSLPDGAGSDLIPELTQAGTHCVLVTGHAKPKEAEYPEVDWVEKPLTSERLENLLDQLAT